MEPSVPAVPPPMDTQLIEQLLGDVSLEPRDQPYPATTKLADGMVNGIDTTVMSMNFADRIMITISQNGRLGQWCSVSLENMNPGTEGVHTLPSTTDENALLPLPEFTVSTMLGPRGSDRETVAHLLTTQIASAIATKSPDETRTLVVGLGIDTTRADPETFGAILDLVLPCL